MSKTKRILITVFGGWFGLHKYMDKKIGMGLLYTFTYGLFCIGWIVDIIIAITGTSKTTTAGNPSIQTADDYISSLYSEVNYDIQRHNFVKPFIERYYKGLESIESMWSVMYNLKITSGEKADMFEQKCFENLTDLKSMLQAQQKCGFEGDIPPHVPAYVRLAMLYEKQERYQDAIDICVEAIKAGAISDGNKGKMYGRLARLIRKSGINVSEDILALSTKTS